MFRMSAKTETGGYTQSQIIHFQGHYLAAALCRSGRFSAPPYKMCIPKFNLIWYSFRAFPLRGPDRKMNLKHLRYECRLCADVIESVGALACCRCGAICIDALDGGLGASIPRWRQLGLGQRKTLSPGAPGKQMMVSS